MQPRKHHSEESLQGLADSIRQHGMLSPITVTNAPEGGRYQIVTGERRWRAAKLARLGEIPCVIKELADDERLTVQLIEESPARGPPAARKGEGHPSRQEYAQPDQPGTGAPPRTV